MQKVLKQVPIQTLNLQIQESYNFLPSFIGSNSLKLNQIIQPLSAQNGIQNAKKMAKHRKNNGVFNVQGHRGVGKRHNTMSAFKECIKMNLDGIELDVWYTRDKKMAVIHGEGDEGLILYRGEKIRIVELTLEQLQEIQVYDIPTSKKNTEYSSENN